MMLCWSMRLWKSHYLGEITKSVMMGEFSSEWDMER